MTRRKENDYLNFKNPIHIVWRRGTPEDPYVDKLDIMPVANQRIILSEIPDKIARIKISNMKEINHERFIEDTIEPNEFYCDYTNGFVYFHRSKEGETLGITYKGRGVILYPSTRIVHINGENVKESLYEIVEKSKLQILDLIAQTANYQEFLDRLKEEIGNAQSATDNAIDAAKYANQSAKDLEKAYETTFLLWKPFVDTEEDIRPAYPDAQIGWTTQAKDTGIRYRYDGKEWIPIDILGGSVPLATEEVDGLMSKEDFSKLKDISPQVNTKTIVFVLPQENLSGVQDPHVLFPYRGEITDLELTVTGVGREDSEIVIEKSSDFEKWESITSEPILLRTEEHYADLEDIVLSNTVVEKGDIFRVNIVTAGITENMSININVSLDTK